MERELLEKGICPVCGQPYTYIEPAKRGRNVYLLAVHERRVGGRREVKKHYLGPAEKYIYIGALKEPSAYVDYVYRAVTKLIFGEPFGPVELGAKREELLNRLREEVGRLGELDLKRRRRGIESIREAFRELWRLINEAAKIVEAPREAPPVRAGPTAVAAAAEAKAEPVRAAPVKAEPVKTEAEAVKAEPVKAEPAMRTAPAREAAPRKAEEPAKKLTEKDVLKAIMELTEKEGLPGREDLARFLSERGYNTKNLSRILRNLEEDGLVETFRDDLVGVTLYALTDEGEEELVEEEGKEPVEA